tara:strand:+ start:203 stop:604 length:402 start_codon:yes stop_codon:yes gene_type:complete
MANAKRQDVVYSDIRSDVAFHPASNDILLNTNELAIQNSIKNLLMTNRYERPFQPNIGSDVKQMLFENFSMLTEARVRNAIIETIENFEPRCNIIDVIVAGDPDNNRFDVEITFNVVNKQTPVTFDVILSRVN